ncbi:MAG: hypothetical protein QOG52_1240 [Frankiaceae bacterium]|jgi:hypothetical protein|nr:hypothetical protein [Frankiaceae bacterium]MDQ1714231.1 hypothetical protein [Frankiaceae bacterium]MDQ1724212.1 hypothetical protein [Frankiaceae bacterium]
MAWVWRYTRVAEDGDGGGEPRPHVESFPTQSDAETWLGEQWRDLRAEGVVSATLLDGDRVVYGPMALEV